MIEPTLNYVTCTTATPDATSPTHRMAYWEWNQTGQCDHPHVMLLVHGLTRQGRDFDVLAQRLSLHGRVICPDVAGRGASDWLPDPMAYGLPQYTLDMVTLLQHVHQQASMHTLDWLGTSMGGLIGMCVAGSPQLPLPVPVRKLLLNDVGPELQWQGLQRIASYVGQHVHFATVQDAVAMQQRLSAGFGPHTEAQWQALTRHMIKPVPDGGYIWHYDPAIAVALRALTPEQALQGQTVLWSLYEGIKAQTLLVRGASSDLLSRDTARMMSQRGPCARCIELEGVGHAPTFVSDGQVAIVQDFFLGDE